MGFTIYWRQEQAFTPEEWKLVARQAPRLVGEATAAGVALAVDLSQPDRIAFNGVGHDEGEPFVLTRELRPLENWEEPGSERDNWCKTHDLPYSRYALDLLRFAARLAPETLSAGSDPSEAKIHRQQHEAATGLAVRAFLEQPATRPSQLVVSIADAVPCEESLAREAVREVRRKVVDQRFAPHLFSDGPLHLELNVESGDVSADHGRTTMCVVNSPAEALNEMLRYVSAHGLDDRTDSQQAQPVAFGRFLRGSERPGGSALGTLQQDGTIVVLCPELLHRYAEAVNQLDPYVPGVDPGQARQQCAALAEDALGEDEFFDFNALVDDIEARTHAEPGVARASVEEAHRAASNVRPLAEELRRAKSLVCALQDGLRHHGSRLPAAAFGAGATAPPRLDHHFGTLLARAGGEWEVAFVSAERALSDPEGFYRLAASAAERLREDGPDEYPCVIYRQEQAKRASVHLLLGSFARWRAAANTFSRALSGLVAEDSPCHTLATYLHGNGFNPEDYGPSPTLAEAVGALAKEAAVIPTFKVGGEREVARDYLNLLEVANELGLEPVLETKTFRRLNQLARGTDQTAAQATEDFLLESDGAAMLGEATVVEGIHQVNGDGGESVVEWNAYRATEEDTLESCAAPAVRPTGGRRR